MTIEDLPDADGPVLPADPHEAARWDDIALLQLAERTRRGEAHEGDATAHELEALARSVEGIVAIRRRRRGDA